MKKIEKVVGDVDSGMVEVLYQDGSAAILPADGPCVAFMADGLIVAVGDELHFYDAEPKEVAVKPKSELGDCVGVAEDFYSFTNQNGDTAVDREGNMIPWPHPWTEASVEEAFDRGISWLRGGDSSGC